MGAKQPLRLQKQEQPPQLMARQDLKNLSKAWQKDILEVFGALLKKTALSRNPN